MTRPILKLRHPEPEVQAAQEAAQAAPTTKRFDGCWLIYRKVPRGFARPKSGRHMPRFRHETFASAEQEAARLLELHPESTFVLMQERAVVKAKAREQ